MSTARGTICASGSPSLQQQQKIKLMLHSPIDPINQSINHSMDHDQSINQSTKSINQSINRWIKWLDPCYEVLIPRSID